MMDMAISVASGGQALGSLPVQRGSVVYFSLEDIDRLFQGRVEKMEHQFKTGVTILHRCRKFDQGGLEDIEQIVAVKQPRLLVIDTFNKVRRDARENVPIQQREYGDLDGLSRISKDHDVAIVIVMHTRKSKGKNHIEQVAGSHGLTGAADNVITLESSGRGTGTLRVDGRNLPQAEFSLTQDETTMRWRVAGPNIAEALNEGQERVLGHLRENAGQKPSQIATALGMNRSTVSNHLQRLVALNRVYTNGQSTRARAYHAMPEAECAWAKQARMDSDAA